MFKHSAHKAYLITLCAINAIFQNCGQVIDGGITLTTLNDTVPNEMWGLYYECKQSKGDKMNIGLCEGAVSEMANNKILLNYNATEVAVWIHDVNPDKGIYQEDIKLSLEKLDCIKSTQHPCDISFVVVLEYIGNNSLQLPQLCCTIVLDTKFELKNGSHCLFWDGYKYESNFEDDDSDWNVTENCILPELNETFRELTVCIERSFGNFSVKMKTKLDSSIVPTTNEHTKNLIFKSLEIPGVILSFFGDLVIIITFVAFRKFRKSNSHHVMLHFSISAIMDVSCDIIFQNLSFKSMLTCAITEKFCHYFMLAYMCWLFVQCLLMYMRFVKVIGTYVPYFIWKASLFSWGTPLLIVALNIAIIAYYPTYQRWTIEMCFYPPKIFLNLFYILPMVLILLGNVVILVMVNRGIYCSFPKINLRSNQAQKVKNMRRLRATFASVMLLGLEWMILILSTIDYPSTTENIFYKLHYVLGGWIRFAIVLVFILTDSSFKKMWLRR